MPQPTHTFLYPFEISVGIAFLYRNAEELNPECYDLNLVNHRSKVFEASPEGRVIFPMSKNDLPKEVNGPPPLLGLPVRTVQLD